MGSPLITLRICGFRRPGGDLIYRISTPSNYEYSVLISKHCTRASSAPHELFLRNYCSVCRKQDHLIEVSSSDW